MQDLETMIGRPADKPYFEPESALWLDVPVEVVRQIVPSCTADGGVAVLRDPEGAYHVVQGPYASVWRAINPQSYAGAGLKAPCTVVNVPAEAA